ncbi:MAG: protein kinase [Lentisphaeria bacterium]|nr:protein kinase [Lentisphaeria bacterium]
MNNAGGKFAVNEQIGDFTIISFVGSGSYGDVYYVSDPLGKKFVLKMIRCEVSSAQEREIYGISTLRSKIRAEKSLPVIYHVGKFNNQLYYTMDAADNCSTDPEKYLPDTLQSRLEKKCRFSAQEIIHTAETILQSIRVLHQNNLVHRDIKPSNIIYLQGNCMLTDFGLLSNNPVTLVGSPGFFAPPPPGGITLESEKAADLFALGKVIYCLFSGEPAERFPLLPPDYNTQELAVIRPLYNKACAVNPARRFSNCDEFLRALKNAQLALDSAKKTSRKGLIPLLTAAVTATLLAAVALLSGKDNDRKAPPPIPEPAAHHEAFVKIFEQEDAYQILCCFQPIAEEDSDPHSRPNQFKAMRFVKNALENHLHALPGEKIKITHAEYLRQPFRDGVMLVYIYRIKKADCSLVIHKERDIK